MRMGFGTNVSLVGLSSLINDYECGNTSKYLLDATVKLFFGILERTAMRIKELDTN